MKKLIILIPLILTGCGMSNEDIIKDTELCNSNDMDITVHRWAATGPIHTIECTPKSSVQEGGE